MTEETTAHRPCAEGPEISSRPMLLRRSQPSVNGFREEVQALVNRKRPLAAGDKGRAKGIGSRPATHRSGQPEFFRFDNAVVKVSAVYASGILKVFGASGEEWEIDPCQFFRFKDKIPMWICPRDIADKPVQLCVSWTDRPGWTRVEISL